MTPEEQYNALVMERDIANDNIVDINNQISKITDVLKAYTNATPEQQNAAKPYLQQVLDKYNDLKIQRAQQEDRWGVAQNALNNYQASVQQQTSTTPVKRISNNVITPEAVVIPSTTETPITETVIAETPATSTTVKPVVVNDVSQLPENIQKIYYTNNGRNWTLTQWKWISTMDYLGNVAQWVMENINPQTWVYQNNSRAPWYNLWRKIGNAVVPVAWALGAQYLVWPNTSAEDAALNSLFKSNVNKVTNIPSTSYTTSPSNIPIKWTSPSNLPKYFTTSSKAPIPNLWSSNPSNIAITPTSLTKFAIPTPVTL